MNFANLHSGTQIASTTHDLSPNIAQPAKDIKTLGDLLGKWAEEPPLELPMLRSTCGLLATYLGHPPDEIQLDTVDEARSGFRDFLVRRKNKRNSIRSYVNYHRIILKEAQKLGWAPYENLSEDWRNLISLASSKKCGDLAKHLARTGKRPQDLTAEDVEGWIQMRVQQGRTFTHAKHKTTVFWRILRDSGFSNQLPVRFLRERDYGVPLEQLPTELKNGVQEILRWKQADYAIDRPSSGKIRKISARSLQYLFGGLFGFARQILNASDINSVSQLVQKRIVGPYVEWLINERKVKGDSLQPRLGTLLATLQTHPSYSSTDYDWLKVISESLPKEPESELKNRKAAKYLGYEVVEAIPKCIRAGRPAAMKKGPHRVAALAAQELLMKWLVTLPWRQRNIRECRINGSEPNLFLAKIPQFRPINKQAWVLEIEQKNPEAKFWQFHFSPSETKTGIEIHAILPRTLIGHLEEYLEEFRPSLIKGNDPGTLFVNRKGTAVSTGTINYTVATLTQRFGGRRVTPHLFRDIVAYTWLKEHSNDFLTLSKMLWHSNINTTIKKYGGRFNESNGVCAMESWIEKREAKSC